MGTWGQGVQLLTVGTWGAGGPAANSGYMRARGRGYMGEGVQLLTVGTWGQGGVGTWGRGSSCLQWVHGGRGI